MTAQCHGPMSQLIHYTAWSSDPLDYIPTRRDRSTTVCFSDCVGVGHLLSDGRSCRTVVLANSQSLSSAATTTRCPRTRQTVAAPGVYARRREVPATDASRERFEQRMWADVTLERQRFRGIHLPGGRPVPPPRFSSRVSLSVAFKRILTDRGASSCGSGRPSCCSCTPCSTCRIVVVGVL